MTCNIKLSSAKDGLQADRLSLAKDRKEGGSVLFWLDKLTIRLIQPAYLGLRLSSTTEIFSNEAKMGM